MKKIVSVHFLTIFTETSVRERHPLKQGLKQYLVCGGVVYSVG